MSIRKTTSGILGSMPSNDEAPTETAEVIGIGAGTVDVRIGDGTVYRRVPLAGGASPGGTVEFRIEGGKPQAYGAGAGGVGGALILGGSAGDVAPGLYVPLSRSINTTNGLIGGGTLANDLTLQVDSTVVRTSRQVGTTNGLIGGGALTSDLTLQVDSTVARAGWQVVGGGSLGGGGGLSAAGITITMNTPGTITPTSANNSSVANHTHALDVNAAWTWGGLHTFNASARVATNQSIGTPTFVSGFTGSGWRVDHGISTSGQTSAEFDNLTVRGVMRVYELLIHKIRTGNGSYLFAPGGKVESVTGSGPYTITFESDHGLAVNDLIRAQKFDLALGGTYQSNMTVTAVNSTTQIVASLHSGSAPVRGYEYARIGNTSNTDRQGGVYVTSDDSNAPYLDVFDGVSSFADWGASSKTRLRLGRLSGWGSHYPTTTYGLVAGQVNGLWIGVDATNGFRIMSDTTQIARWDTAGNITVGRTSGNWIGIDTTNGVRIMQGGTQLARWDIAGNITIGEVAAGKTNTFISAGEIQFRSNLTSFFKIASDGRVVITPGVIEATAAINWEIAGHGAIARLSCLPVDQYTQLKLHAIATPTTHGLINLMASGGTGASFSLDGANGRIEASRVMHLSASGGGLMIGTPYTAPPSSGILTTGQIRSGGSVRVNGTDAPASPLHVTGMSILDGAVRIGSTAAPSTTLDVTGSIRASTYVQAVDAFLTRAYTIDWFRSHGATGWYNQDYGGGIYMTDSTWIRTYGGKSFYCSEGIRAEKGAIGGNMSVPVSHCKFIAGVSGTGYSAQAAIYITTGMGTGWQQITNVGVTYRTRVVGVLVIPGVGAFDVSALVVAGVETLLVDHNGGSGNIYRLSMLCNSNGVYVRSNFANYNGHFSTMLICA